MANDDGLQRRVSDGLLRRESGGLLRRVREGGRAREAGKERVKGRVGSTHQGLPPWVDLPWPLHPWLRRGPP